MMLWQQIPDLKDTKKYLSELYIQKRLPHALLLIGEDGNAALPLALGFMQYLHCDHPNGFYPCGECRSCKQTQNLFYPGFHFVLPKFSTSSQKSESEDDTDVTSAFYRLFKENPFISYDDVLKEVKGKNKQALISVKDIEQIIQNISYSAVGDKYNIVCIWKPEMMLAAAANKLLKTLEEPPPQSLFLLVSSHPEELLATIISRVQQYRVPAFSEKDITDYLITQFNINQDKAQEIAFISNGNINKAIHILNNYEEYIALLNDFKEFARLAIKFEMASIEQWIKKYESEGREALKRFLEYSLDIFHYSLLQHFHLQDKIKATQQEKDFIAKFYPYANEDNIPKLYELFNDAYHHTVRNANVRILLTDLFLRCNELFKKKVNV